MPQPAVVADETRSNESKARTVKDGEGGGIEEHTAQESKESIKNKGRAGVGPWDRSRSFGEGEMRVGEVIQPPPATVASVHRGERTM